MIVRVILYTIAWHLCQTSTLLCPSTFKPHAHSITMLMQSTAGLTLVRADWKQETLHGEALAGLHLTQACTALNAVTDVLVIRWRKQ